MKKKNMKKEMKANITYIAAGTRLSVGAKVINDESFHLIDDKTTIEYKDGYSQLITARDLHLGNDDMPTISYQGEEYFIRPTLQ